MFPSIRTCKDFPEKSYNANSLLYNNWITHVSQTFVVVDIQVVWSGEDGDERGETCSLTLPVHTVPEERETNKPPTLQPLKQDTALWMKETKICFAGLLKQPGDGQR